SVMKGRGRVGSPARRSTGLTRERRGCSGVGLTRDSRGVAFLAGVFLACVVLRVVVFFAAVFRALVVFFAGVLVLRGLVVRAMAVLRPAGWRGAVLVKEGEGCEGGENRGG